MNMKSILFILLILALGALTIVQLIAWFVANGG